MLILIKLIIYLWLSLWTPIFQGREINKCIWTDGNIVDEKDAFGYKVTYNITDPDLGIVLDEVGGNTNQKGDGYLEGELILCKTGKSTQRKINNKNKHYTVLGRTSLR